MILRPSWCLYLWSYDLPDAYTYDPTTFLMPIPMILRPSWCLYLWSYDLPDAYTYDPMTFLMPNLWSYNLPDAYTYDPTTFLMPIPMILRPSWCLYLWSYDLPDAYTYDPTTFLMPIPMILQPSWCLYSHIFKNTKLLLKVRMLHQCMRPGPHFLHMSCSIKLCLGVPKFVYHCPPPPNNFISLYSL